jgi:O-antigen/teichoic acid export membrane protein
MEKVSFRLGGLLIARLLPGTINLFTFLLLTRTLLPGEYGVYALVMSSAMMASGVGFHWLVQGISRFSFKWRGERSEFIAAVAFGFFVSALLLSIVYPFVASEIGFEGQYRQRLILAAIIIAVLQGLYEIIAAMAVAEIRNKAYAKIVFTKAGFTLVLVYFLLDYQPNYSAALFAVMLGLSCAILVNFGSLSSFLAPRPTRIYLGAIFFHGFPVGAHYGLQLGLVFIDRSVVAAVLGESAVGYLAATSDVTSQTLVMLMSVVHMSFYPLLVREWESVDQHRILKVFEKGFRLLVLFGLISATFAAVFSSNLAFFMVGGQFRTEVQALIPWVVAATLISCLKAFYTDTVFILNGRAKWLVPQTLLLLVVTFLLQSVVVPKFGLSGAAVVTVVVQSIGLCISFWLARRLFPLPIDLKITAAMGLVCLSVIIISWPFRNATGLTPALFQLVAYVFLVGVLWFRFNRKEASNNPIEKA